MCLSKFNLHRYIKDTKRLVLNLREARKAHDRIMVRHRVPNISSQDLI
jgi:hypothetical protein